MAIMGKIGAVQALQYVWDGTAWVVDTGGGGGGIPGGADTSIQFNDNGAFGGFGTWDGSTLALSLQVPTNPLAVGGTSGSLDTGDYYFKVVALDGLGGTTTGSAEVSATIAAPDDGTGSVVVTWNLQGAALFRVYVGVTPGGEDHYFTADPTLGQTFTLVALGGVAGSVPVLNTAISDALLTAGGVRVPFNTGLVSYGDGYGGSVNLIRLTTTPTAYYGQITIGDSGFGSVDFDLYTNGTISPSSTYSLGTAGKPFGDVHATVSLLSSVVYLGANNTATSFFAGDQFQLTEGGGDLDNISVAGGFRFNIQGGTTGYNSLYPSINYKLDSANRAMFWGPDLVGASSFPYFLWHNGTGTGAGVWRVNALGIQAYYNPAFATYTPGAVDFERIVQQWNTNVAEMGAEAGGTGVQRALRLLGASVSTAGTLTAGAFSGGGAGLTGIVETGLSLSDVTTANVSATKHGFAPKFPNNTTTFLRGDGTYAVPPGTSTGTVTSVSVTTANGVSGSVATATTTPAITLTLGAITPFTVNGLTLTTGSGTLTLGSVTLNAGAGGTLGSNAFTSTAYAPIASPTFTGVVTLPTPFTLGAVSVTTTGTQLNYLAAAAGTTGTASTNLVFSAGPTLTGTLASGPHTITQVATATGVLKALVVSDAINTNQTASTEVSTINFALTGRQWATGAITTQREVLFAQPTYSFVGSSTITDAASVAIVGAPIKGTNALLTNTHALLIQAGAVSTATNSYGLTVNAQTGATTNYAAQFMGGNVGVGTATPTRSISMVSSDANTSPGFNISATSSGGRSYSLLSTCTNSGLGSGKFAIYDDGASTLRMIFTGSGQVGVGTLTAPTAMLHIQAGTATASTAPLKFTSGTNLTTAEAGAMEYNGTNLFFTRAGATRENMLVAVDNATAPSTSVGVGIVNFYGASATNFLGDPNRWMSINILGTVYKVPLYT